MTSGTITDTVGCRSVASLLQIDTAETGLNPLAQLIDVNGISDVARYRHGAPAERNGHANADSVRHSRVA